MNKKQLIVTWAMGAILLSGCATVNFSANYYTPPDNYQAEVRKLWHEFMSRVSLLYDYKMNIVSEHECKNGIPEIEQRTVKIPDNFIKYIYQNYYEDRFKVLLCTASHEVCHIEYNLLDQSTPEAHFQVDQKAIEVLKTITICSTEDYYKSLMVMRDYWFARKGAGGHMFNVGWNILNAASVAYGGSGYFVDWFATDLDGRLALISKQYGIESGSRFKRSLGDNKIICLEESNFESLFLTKKIRNYAEEQHEKMNRWVAWKRIKNGMNESQVIEILGKPNNLVYPPDKKMIAANGPSSKEEYAYTVVYNYEDGGRVEFSLPPNNKDSHVISWVCPEL